MYWRVVPGLGARDARHPEELLEGTDEDVVVVGEVVVGVAAEAEAEAEPAISGTHDATANMLTKARAESAGGRSRKGRARLS
jgi:hypothetical protein